MSPVPTSAGKRLRTLAKILALGAAAAASPSAWANTYCSALISSFSFGAIPLTSPSTLTGTVTVTCTTASTSWFGVRVKYCVNFGDGSGGAGPNLTPRYLRNASNAPLNLELAPNAMFSSPLGSIRVPSTVPIVGEMNLSTSMPTATALPVVIHARIPAQPTLAVGTYQSSFAGLHAEVTSVYNDALLGGMPTSCWLGAGTPMGVTTTFSASATVVPECNLSTVDILDFGQISGLPGPAVTATAAINMSCRPGTDWRLSLDDGLHAEGTNRRMSNGSGAYAHYELYRDAARTQRFGQTVNVDQQAGTGTGSSQSVTVYGRIPAAQNLTPGSYSDRVVVTVTY